MKKYITIISVAAAAVALSAAASCQKEQTQDNRKPDEEIPAGLVKSTFTATQEAAKKVAEEGAEATAAAQPGAAQLCAAQSEAAQSEAAQSGATRPGAAVKTVLDPQSGAVSWAEGDKLVFAWEIDGAASSAASDAVSDIDVETGKAKIVANIPDGFSDGDFSGEGRSLYAVYPSSVSAEIASSKLSITVPGVQDGTFAGANISAAECVTGSSELALKNIGGLLQLTIEDASVRKVIFDAGETSVAGKAEVTFNEGVPTTNVTAGVSTVTLNVSGAGTYYISVLPCTLNGFSVELQNGGGDVIGSKASANSLSISRGEIKSIGTVESGFRFFASPEGRGNKSGINWDNAADISGLKAKVAADEVSDIYLAAGVYSITESLVSDAAETAAFNIYGGYPSDATSYSFDGRDVKVNATIFDGGSSTSIWSIGKGEYSFDGVTFRNATDTETDGTDTKNGGAVCITGGKTTFTDCVFTSNKFPLVSNGGALSVKDATVVLEHCQFSGNEARNGASVFLDGTADVSATDCSFTNEKAFNTGGAFNVSGGTLTLTDCSFSATEATPADGLAGLGGAVHINSTGTKAELTGCSFTGTHAYKGGALSLGTAVLTATDCTFTDVYSTNHGGMALLDSESAKLTLKDCNISGAYSESGNSGAVSVNAGELIAENTTFDSCTLKGQSNSPVARINKWLDSSEDGDPSKATFTGCTFSKNTNPATESTSSNTAGCFSIGKATVKFDGCTFDGNKASRGGAFTTVHADADVEATCCTFKNNYASEVGGVYNIQKAGGKVTFTDCTFEKNSSKGEGGVFYADYASENLYISGCTFKENASGGNGGICSNWKSRNGSVWHFDDCLFTGNTAPSRGLFNSNSANTGENVFMFNGCTFYNNKMTNSSNMWGILTHGAVLPCINNCTVYNDTSIPAMAIVNSDRGALCINSTLICSAASYNEKAAFRVNYNTGKLVISNNIILKRGGVMAFSDSESTITSDHNLYGADWGSKGAASASDVKIADESAIGGSYDTTKNAYIWSGSVDGFTAATKDDVVKAIEAFDMTSNGTNVGAAFKTWLESLPSKPLDRSYDRPGSIK